jgi:hypothetical protein
MKLLIAFLLSSANALTRFRENAMLLINASLTTNTTGSISSPTSSTTVTTPLSPLGTTTNDAWMNVFNDRSNSKPAFALGIDPNLALGNTTHVSLPLPGFVLLQYLLAQRAEIIPIYYQLTAFLFRQIPLDDTLEQTEVSFMINIDQLIAY